MPFISELPDSIRIVSQVASVPQTAAMSVMETVTQSFDKREVSVANC